jgi:1-acyl-sn-glycerol-3-phosphate acyltransferase
MPSSTIIRSRYNLPRILSRIILFFMGWHIRTVPIDQSKYIMIGAPHTSNWDFVIGYLMMTAIGLKLSWVGKHTLFRKPYGWFLRWIGGIPVNRELSTKFVDQVVQKFNSLDHLIVVMSPEGTRKKTEHWRTGFYYMAKGAEVPVIAGFLDYPNKVGGIGKVIHLTGDMEADIREFQEFYSGITGKYPEKMSEISFKKRK